MTNTLHRQGTRESLEGDFVLFATPAKGYTKEGCTPKLQEFQRIVMRHQPVNWRRMDEGQTYYDTPEQYIANMSDGSLAAATFDSVENLRAALAELKAADLGISINISGLLEAVEECCHSVGITRHSVENSLGVKGDTALLPKRSVMELHTMCGHGLVSFNLVQKVIEQVKLEKITPAEGARLLTKPCVCGVFNPARAEKLLDLVRQFG